MTYEPGKLSYIIYAFGGKLTYLSRGQKRGCGLRSGVLDYHVEHRSPQPPNQGKHLQSLPIDS